MFPKFAYKFKVMDTEKVLLGFLAGVAVGATLGILFAPDSGANTRKKISQKGQDYAGGLKDQFNKLTGSLNEELDNLKDEANQMAASGKAKAKDLKEDFNLAKG